MSDPAVDEIAAVLVSMLEDPEDAHDLAASILAGSSASSTTSPDDDDLT
jgi:hypothetical protein